MLKPISYQDCVTFFNNLFVDCTFVDVGNSSWRIYNKHQKEKSADNIAYIGIEEIKKFHSQYQRLFAIVIYDVNVDILIDHENHVITQGNAAICFKPLVEAIALANFQSKI